MEMMRAAPSSILTSNPNSELPEPRNLTRQSSNIAPQIPTSTMAPPSPPASHIDRLPAETLEQILGELDTQTLLLAQRVSPFWQQTVAGSSKLQRNLFLAPESASTIHPGRVNDIFFFGIPSPTGRHAHIKFSRTLDFADCSPSAPWRKMFICQPPVERISLDITFFRPEIEGKGFGREVKEAMYSTGIDQAREKGRLTKIQGITVGDVYDKLLTMEQRTDFGGGVNGELGWDESRLIALKYVLEG